MQQPSTREEGSSVKKNMMRARIVEKDKKAKKPQDDAGKPKQQQQGEGQGPGEGESFQPGWVCLKELICKAGNCGHCHQCDDGVLPSEARRQKNENDYLLSPQGPSHTRHHTTTHAHTRHHTPTHAHICPFMPIHANNTHTRGEPGSRSSPSPLPPAVPLIYPCCTPDLPLLYPYCRVTRCQPRSTTPIQRSPAP